MNMMVSMRVVPQSKVAARGKGKYTATVTKAVWMWGGGTKELEYDP